MYLTSSSIDSACIVKIDSTDNSVTLTKPSADEVPKTFTYDNVYGIDSTQ